MVNPSTLYNSGNVAAAKANENRNSGIVSKICGSKSFGFIRPDNSTSTNNQIFFHLSELNNESPENLRHDDRVEYNRSFDFRAKRWLAVAVSKIQLPEKVSKDTYKGEIDKLARPESDLFSPRNGRIAYEIEQEKHYIEFKHDRLQLKEHQQPEKGDTVYFKIANDQTNQYGEKWATEIQLAEAATRVRGVICSVKKDFGFIERADIVKEVFYHTSECENAMLGDNVEFSVVKREERQIAIDIKKLPKGTVKFQETSDVELEGLVIELCSDLWGKIRYITDEGQSTDIDYNFVGMANLYTLYENDIVSFRISTDVRDGAKSAAMVRLKTFDTEEKRWFGTVDGIKDSFGFIRIHDKAYIAKYGKEKIFFHMNEVFNPDDMPLSITDEVKFTHAVDPSAKKPVAIRIQKLVKGALSDNRIISECYTGTVIQNPMSGLGVIQCQTQNGAAVEFKVPYDTKDMDLHYKDEISFNIYESVYNQEDRKEQRAINIKLIGRLPAQRGIISTLRRGEDRYGFIESLDCRHEIFFHFSHFKSSDQLPLNDPSTGDIVCFQLACRKDKISAENVRKIELGNVKYLAASFRSGFVARKLRSGSDTRANGAPNGATNGATNGSSNGSSNGSFNEKEYTAGEIKDCDTEISYPFGLSSLIKRHSLEVGIKVHFQVLSIGEFCRAVNISPASDVMTGHVHTVKLGYGFISYCPNQETGFAREKASIYFRLVDVLGDTPLCKDDQVRFVILPASHKKSSAIAVFKIGLIPDQRPARLRAQTAEASKVVKATVSRQPLAPAGQGFMHPKKEENKSVEKNNNAAI